MSARIPAPFRFAAHRSAAQNTRAPPGWFAATTGAWRQRLRQTYSLMLRRYRKIAMGDSPLVWRKFRQLERMAERVRDAAIAAAAAAPEMGAR